MGKRIRPNKWLLVFIVLSAAGCGAGAGAFLGLTRDLPQIRNLTHFQPSAVSRIFSADGELLAELFFERRDPVPLGRMPRYLKAAVIATEDRKFYTHSGIDLKGILRAVVRNIWAGEYAEGASTITQQLAKTLFLTPKKTLQRKIKEALLAFQLERRYTKDEILALYLNQIYFGSGAYGVASAAHRYFKKSLDRLTIAECALIAGLPKAPSRLSPLVDAASALTRRNVVLRQMHHLGIISTAEWETAVKEPLRTLDADGIRVRAGHFVDYVKSRAEQIVGHSLLYKGGLTIYTTLSCGLQSAAEDAIQEGLAAIDQRMRRRQTIAPKPQAALLALTCGSGEILSMVGGHRYAQSPYNRAIASRRQPGSAFKPIIYALAIEKGFSQTQMILDAPVVFKNAKQGRDWRPENFSRTFAGEMTLRAALAMSKNIPAVRLLETLGPSTAVRFADALGIQSPLSANLSLALGTSAVSLLELTSVYSVFANAGKWIEPFGIHEIVDRTGQLLWRAKPDQRIVMSRVGAAIVTDMLQAAITEGTGRRASTLAGPLAGKTGTTDDYRDALFVGFSPATVCGVWVGRDDAQSLGEGETGAKAAIPIWMAFMKSALEREPMPPAYFDMPEDVRRVWLNPLEGTVFSEKKIGTVGALVRR